MGRPRPAERGRQRNPHRRWLLMTAAGMSVGYALPVMVYVHAANEPPDGTDSAGMAMMSAVGVAGTLTMAIIALVVVAVAVRPPVPRGWYRDPFRPAGIRFWDGARWTAWVDAEWPGH